MMSNAKISIRFFDDREVRAFWDEQNAKWWLSVLDIVAVLTDQDDYTKYGLSKEEIGFVEGMIKVMG